MAVTRLTNAMRSTTVRRLVEHHSRKRAVALRRSEQALATRMLRNRYGEDVFERAAALPEGWLKSTKHLSIDYELRKILPKTKRYVEVYRRNSERVCWAEKTAVELAEYAPLPDTASEGWNRLTLSQRLYDDLYGLCQNLHDFEEQLAETSTKLTAALNSYFTVEAFADGWPEGYAFFPMEMLAKPLMGYPVPMPRVEDLNAALEALTITQAA